MEGSEQDFRMSTTREIVIPIPVHPDDKDLPLSVVQLKLSKGVFVLTFPMQGRKTIQNIIDTLEIWKPTIVTPDPFYEI